MTSVCGRRKRRRPRRRLRDGRRVTESADQINRARVHVVPRTVFFSRAAAAASCSALFTGRRGRGIGTRKSVAPESDAATACSTTFRRREAEETVYVAHRLPMKIFET